MKKFLIITASLLVSEVVAKTEIPIEHQSIEIKRKSRSSATLSGRLVHFPTTPFAIGVYTRKP